MKKIKIKKTITVEISELRKLLNLSIVAITNSNNSRDYIFINAIRKYTKVCGLTPQKMYFSGKSVEEGIKENNAKTICLELLKHYPNSPYLKSCLDDFIKK